jgi:hypothetical protein
MSVELSRPSNFASELVQRRAFANALVPASLIANGSLGETMDQLDGDEYECYTCKQRFRSASFSISREWNRVNYAGDEPEVEIQGSEGLECYCSQACATSRRDLVMEREVAGLLYRLDE